MEASLNWKRVVALNDKTAEKEPRTALSNDPNCVCAWFPEDPHGWIVNFSNHPVKIDGVIWKTVEHFYQCQKFIGYPDIIERMAAAPTPKKAKEIAYEPLVVTLGRKDWKNVRDEVMLKGLTAKVTQHKDIRDALLSTGNLRIVEDSPVDSYWGCGKDGKGTNRLGHLWEQIRDMVRNREL